MNNMYYVVSTAYLELMWLGFGNFCILLLFYFIVTKLKLVNNILILLLKIGLLLVCGAQLAIFIWLLIKLPVVGCPPWPVLPAIFSLVAAILIPNKTKLIPNKAK